MLSPINPQSNQSINQIKDNFIDSNTQNNLSVTDSTVNKNIPSSQNQQSPDLMQDIFNPNISKDEAIKKIESLIAQKENELESVNSKIQELLNSLSNTNQNISNVNVELLKYQQASKQIELETLNMQKQSLENQIHVLNQRKDQLINEKKQEEEQQMNIEQISRNMQGNYQDSIEQLKNLKNQLELYQKSMNSNYQKQIESINSQINKLQKEIEDLLNQQPSTPEEAEQIAQKIAEKRNFIQTLKGQMDLLSQESTNLNTQINQQIMDLDRQILDIRKQMQVDFYNKWAMDQAMRREIEQIIWTEMLNKKNHIANLWKMYFDTNNKIQAMWKDMYLKKVADNSSFAAQWAKALGV